jgi:hypothetical protein
LENGIGQNKQNEAEKKVEYMTHIERTGIKKGQASFLLCLLEDKFGPLSPDIQATVHRLDENRLFEWFKRSLRAQTLREVVGQ